MGERGNDDYVDNDDDGQTTGGLPEYGFFVLKKKIYTHYTPVNLLSGHAEKCCTRQKVFPVDLTSGAFVTEGVCV